MMCRKCQTPYHLFAECLFPQSCTCQHRQPEMKEPQIGKEVEPSPGSFTAQEQSKNAADRLEA